MFKGKTEIMRHISIVTIALAGLVHLLIVPAHYAHAPAHGIFFALAGILQVTWAVAFWRHPSLALYRTGLGRIRRSRRLMGLYPGAASAFWRSWSGID